jgi:pyrimidine-specific ribonucleoside hydrolase
MLFPIPKKPLCLLLFVLLFTGSALAHSGKPKYHVIIDTDGAIDDMRALSMFLAGNDIRTLAITCSQGSLLPDIVYQKVMDLLSTYHHQGIPIGIGDKTNLPLPQWADFAASVIWGKPDNNELFVSGQTACDVLYNVTRNYRPKITLIALGSLKTYADWFKSDPEITKKIERIIWYNDADIQNGFNYNASPESFDVIKKSGIPLDIVSSENGTLMCNQQYLSMLKNGKSIYAKHILQIHEQKPVQTMIRNKHLQLFDDLLPLYLTVPVLFNSEKKDGITYTVVNPQIPEQMIFETIASLLESANTSNNRVFNTFPSDTSLYKKEIAKILIPVIEKYGLPEWKAVCMTNEIHGHTGIYSIIGAKAGIRALEYFNVGVNNLKAMTYAGNAPPLSCFNDGIQIATGATIGQGLIQISDSVSDIPSVMFEFNSQKIKMSLKQPIVEQMKKDISYGIQTYGLESDKYWLYIEELALKYWSDFDRHTIFTISEL